jgi:allantoinase
MPYDVPHSIHSAALLEEKIGWVNRTAHVDVALYGTIKKHGGLDAIPELAAGGITAFKLSTYEYDAVRFPRIDHPTMVDAFALIADTGLPVAVHNEDQELVERLSAVARADPAAAGGDDGRSGDLRDRAADRRACPHRAFQRRPRL